MVNEVKGVKIVGGVRFDFEKLIVYNKSIDFVDKIFRFCDGLPYLLQSSIGDQLRRASLSIVNNIAEGSDKLSSKDKKRFFLYSLDSARECIPVLSICRRRNLISGNEEDSFREECKVICRMLNKSVHSVK
ncbi:MAG: four helix bundle protein [Candidatus Omnitrophota bacterium]